MSFYEYHSDCWELLQKGHLESAYFKGERCMFSASPEVFGENSMTAVVFSAFLRYCL